MLKKQLSLFLNSRRTYIALLAIHLILSCIIFYHFRNLVCGDQDHYLSFADGLKHGRYSHWWFLPQYIPDTFRTPGYPVFLFLLEKIYSNIYFLKFFQFILYLASVYLILKIASRFDSGFRLKNIFLLLLIPYIQVTVFTPTIQPETLMTFLLTLFIFIDTSEIKTEWKYTLLGLLSGIIFLVRPVFLFFPFLIVIINIFSLGKKYPVFFGVSMLVIFMLTVLPYGIWNLKNHKVLTITPIEGAGGVFQLGYWSFKMPGYFEQRYWGNVMSDEIVSFTQYADTGKNIKAYNREWDYIDSVCAQYLTREDSVKLVEMSFYPSFFKAYNTKYTMMRERLLRQLTMENIRNDFTFWIKVKLYTLMRLWFTGIQRSQLSNQSSLSKAAVIYFSLVSFLVFLMSFILIPFAFFKHRLNWRNSKTMILLIIYYGLMHIPFAIQARYTIPLRLIMLFLLARTILNLFSHRPTEK